MQMAGGGFQHLTQALLAPAYLFTWPPGLAFWPYFTGVALLAAGLFMIKDEVPQAHGLDKIMPFGRLLFAIPMAVFGTEHFTFPEEVARIVPSWLPAHSFWAYLAGVALIAAALSIVVRRQERLAATLLGILLFLFVALIHLPNVVAHPGDRFAWAVCLRDIAFSGGAFAFAGGRVARGPADGAPKLVTLGRLFIAMPAVFFGVEHFLHPTSVPGVPLEREMPTWIPGRLFWAYLAGAVLVVAGAAMIVNQKTRLAATYMGIMVLLLVLFIYLPILAADFPSIGNGLNYFVDTMAFSGAALVLADALPREDHRRALDRP